MFTKPQHTNVFKLSSLALLLVVFGCIGIGHVFATGEAVQDKVITPVDTNTPNSSTLDVAKQACEREIANGADKKRQDGKCLDCAADGVCCGVKLNTNVPFIGKCIRTGTDGATTDGTTVTETTAFPRLMGGLTKIMTTIILLVCFGGILVGGVMVAASGGSDKTASEGKKLIGKVIIAIALLGTSGIILHLINPNFFG